MTPSAGSHELPHWLLVVLLVLAWFGFRALILWLFFPTRDTYSEDPK